MSQTLTGAVVVTGATGGIGAAIIDSLCAQGVPMVIAACRRPEAFEATKNNILTRYPGCPTRIVTMPLDLSTRERARQGAREILALGEPIEIVINNAGVMPVSKKEFSADGFDWALQVNCLSTLAFTETMLPAIKDGGAVVLTSSIARHFPSLHQNFVEVTARAHGTVGLFLNYSRAKLLLTLAARYLANVEAPRRIRVNCADPGIVDTTLLRTNIGWIDKIVDAMGRPMMNSVSTGARAALNAAFTPLTGAMATPSGVKPIATLTPERERIAIDALNLAAL